MKKIIIIGFLLITYIKSTAQTPITEKDIYAYYMKNYNLKPKDNINNGKVNFGQYRWIDLYLFKFHKYEYNQVKNDEFKIQKFMNKVGRELENNIENVDHNKIFSKIVKAKLGKYDFSTESFPIKYSMEDFGGSNRGYPGGFEIDFEYIVNNACFKPILKMNNEDAEKFINSRKNSNGNVNRTVYLNFHFNITNIVNRIYSPQGGVNGFDQTDLTLLAKKIEIYEDEYLSNIMAFVKIDNCQGQNNHKIIGNWIDEKSGLKTSYNNNATYYTSNNKETSKFKSYGNIIQRFNNRVPFSKMYKINIVGDKLHVSYLNRFGNWKLGWIHRRDN